MQPSLEDYRFTVLIDHQSLKRMHSIVSPSGPLARWNIFLQEYDFEIKYYKGVLNRIADALARNLQPNLAETSSTTEVCVLNGKTECIEVERNPLEYPDYCIKNGHLYRHFWDINDY